MILGADGYLGYPLFIELKKRYDVIGLDNFSRRKMEQYPSLVPIGVRSEIIECEARDIYALDRHTESFGPDVFVHLAEQRSVPFSMMDRRSRLYTLNNNFLTTQNVLEMAKKHNFRIIHIGSMGFYGYENDAFIKEGDKVRNPGSIYHLTKEVDCSLFSFYSKIYGINIAQLHQGTIWGIGGRFDYDAVYGTVVNRFILQKLLKMPLTIYGEGNQQRSFINIINSIESIELVINTHFKNYQSFNLFTEILSINNIAEKVGGDREYLSNPRIESGDSTLESTNERLLGMGLNPIFLSEHLIDEIGKTITPFLNRVEKDLILPKGKWL